MDWLPRRLGGGKGDSRRDREQEKLVRELKKSHPALKSRSRSRSDKKPKDLPDNKEEDKKNLDD